MEYFLIKYLTDVTHLSTQLIIVSYIPHAYGLKVITIQYFNSLYFNFNISYNTKYRLFLYQHVSDKGCQLEFCNFTYIDIFSNTEGPRIVILTEKRNNKNSTPSVFPLRPEGEGLEKAITVKQART